MAFCPSCGSEVGNAKFCQNCGSAIEQNSSPNSKFCSNCGSEIDYKAEICPKCGVRQVSVSSQSSEKNVWVAVLLSLLIVGLGQFYLGLPKKGALLLILTIISWILIAFVIGIILYPLILIYGIYDAYTSAVAISGGKHVEDELFGGKFI